MKTINIELTEEEAQKTELALFDRYLKLHQYIVSDEKYTESIREDLINDITATNYALDKIRKAIPHSSNRQS